MFSPYARSLRRKVIPSRGVELESENSRRNSWSCVKEKEKREMSESGSQLANYLLWLVLWISQEIVQTLRKLIVQFFRLQFELRQSHLSCTVQHKAMPWLLFWPSEALETHKKHSFYFAIPLHYAPFEVVRFIVVNFPPKTLCQQQCHFSCTLSLIPPSMSMQLWRLNISWFFPHSHL